MTSDDICRAINELTVRDYASFANQFVDGVDPRAAVKAEHLLNRKMQEAICERFSQRFSAFDARAALSIWVKWYTIALLPSFLIADILLKSTVELELSRLRFVISKDQRVEAIKIPGARDSASEDPFRRFAPLVFGHFAPLVDLWSPRIGVTKRVLWSNVGNTFEAVLRKIENVSGISNRLSETEMLLNAPSWQGLPNPLFNSVRYVYRGRNQVRLRRVCCLQYLLPDRRFCSACPVEIR